ncbi:MAG: alpha/beta hydrolase fold domain-containing protein [Woeseiaceae bacterium]
MAGWLFLIAMLTGVLVVLNAARPSVGPYSLVPSWLAAFLTTDLAFHHIGLQLLVAAGFIWAGALETLPGKLALVIVVVSSAWLVILWLPNLRAAAATSAVADEFGLDEVETIPRALLWVPLRRRHEGVSVARDVEYSRAAGRVLTMDIYRGLSGGERRPALVYLHGGGWVLGDKCNQGLPLCNHLAKLGWVCANTNYRLSPGATWPDHAIDAKTAIAWLREHAEEWNVDPDFIAIAGGSAGGHIAAMVALTPGAPELQPGFTNSDTSTQAAVTFYGVYDMTNRMGLYGPEFLTKLVGPYVLKAFPDAEPERFSAASPRTHVGRVSQPWLILQGDGDTMTPAAEARDFAEALRERSEHPVVYAELPGAQHAFDIYYSPRAIATVELTARFLATTYCRSSQSRQSQP